MGDDQFILAANGGYHAFDWPIYFLNLFANDGCIMFNPHLEYMGPGQHIQAHSFSSVLVLQLTRNRCVIGVHDVVATEDANKLTCSGCNYRKAANVACAHISNRSPQHIISANGDDGACTNVGNRFRACFGRITGRQLFIGPLEVAKRNNAPQMIFFVKHT